MYNCSMIPDQGSNLQGWVLAIAAGFACCIGASAVFSEHFIPKLKGVKQKQNLNFMVASFALGSGLFSSFFTLLPESKKNFKAGESETSSGHSSFYMIAFYFLGVVGSTLINRLIHHFAADFHHHHHHNDTPIRKISKKNSLILNENSPLLKNHLDERTDDISKIRDFNEADSSDRHAIFVDSDTDECSNSSDHHDLQNPHSKPDHENA
ncbi:21395_t:CDS:2, partial [Racocetra persica]